MYEHNSPFCLAVSVVDLHTLVWNAKSLPGTIRSNLDPFSQHGDAELWDALHRSCLLDSNTTSKQSSSSNEVRSEQASTGRYDLDSTIESEGANLSVGERSLLSLARALVKDCKVVVLDEATLVMCSSLDAWYWIYSEPLSISILIARSSTLSRRSSRTARYFALPVRFAFLLLVQRCNMWYFRPTSYYHFIWPDSGPWRWPCCCKLI